MDDLGARDNISLEILEEEESETIAKLESDAKQPPVVQIVNHTFTEAIKKGASDIHVEPFEDSDQDSLSYRRRVVRDHRLPLRFKDGVISRIKVLSKMDIAEKRLPQDGRIKIQMRMGGRMKNIDIRVSSTPTFSAKKSSCVSWTRKV